MIKRPPPLDGVTPRGVFAEPEQPRGPGRGPFFSADRYPEGEIETETVVPGFDPMRRDRVRGMPELPFEVVVDPSGDKVFFNRGVGRPIAALFALSTVSAAAGMAIRPLAPYLTDSRVTVVWAFLFLWVFIWAKREEASWKLATQLALLVPLTFGLIHVVSVCSAPGWGHVGVGIALISCGFTLDVVTNHWVRLLIATGALHPDPRRAWTRAWENRWSLQWAPSGHRTAAWSILGYPLGFLPLLWLYREAFREDALTALPIGACMLGAVLGFRAGVPVSLRRVGRSIGRAGYSWFFYGRSGMYAPGVLRSPAGPILFRTCLLGVTFALLSATLLPPGEVIASRVTLRGLGPLAQGATLALLFCKLATFPTMIFAGLLLAVAGPVFAAFESLTDGSADERAARQIDFITHTIATSENEVVRRQSLYGYHATEGWPVIVPNSVAEGHERVLGGSGSGKTARAILLRVKQQLACHGPTAGPVLIVDCKPDLNLLFSVKRAAEAAGRKFRFFTNQNLPGHTTHAFNPLLELRETGQPLVRSATSLQTGLGQDWGAGYGRSHFSAIPRGLTRMMLQNAPDARSLREVRAAWQRRRPSLGPEVRRQEEKAYEMILNVEMLCDQPELNVISGRAYEERISMTRAVSDNEVVVFALDPKAAGEAVARFIGSLAVECFYQAILRHNAARDEQGRQLSTFKRGFVAVDEFGLVADRAWGALLESARERGLTFLLAAQSLQTLTPELRVAVETNTAVKQFFTARTPQEVKELAALGGTTMRAMFDLDGNTKLQKSDRLSANILKTMSAEPDLSVLVVEKSADWAMFDGFPILIRTPHCQSKAEYEAARASDWPVYDGLLPVGEEAPVVRGANVVPLPVPAAGVAHASAATVTRGHGIAPPLRGTPLAAMFDRIPADLLGGTSIGASPATQDGTGDRS